MKTKLARVPEGVALILDDALLQQLGWRADMEVELSIRDDSIVITPVRNDLPELLDEMDSEYGDVFRRLADS